MDEFSEPSEPTESPLFITPNHKVEQDETPPPVKAVPRKLTAKKATPKRGFFGGQAKPEHIEAITKAKDEAEEVENVPGQFIEAIENMYTMAGLSAMPFAPEVAMSIAANAHKIAVTWDDLAQKNPAVRRALKKMLTVSAVGAVVAAHVPILTTALIQVPAVQQFMTSRMAGAAEQFANER